MAKQLYKKGESGNPTGRKKGSKNRSTEEIRTFLQAIVNNNLSNLEADLVKMNPTNRWVIIDKLTKYFLPALTKNDNNTTLDGGIKIVVEYKDEPEPDKGTTPEDNKG